MTFPGLADFSDAGSLAAVLSLMRGPPYPYRIAITDETVRIEGRGRVLRALLPSRSCDIDELVSARLRGTLVILYLPNDAWWSVSSMSKSKKIISELRSRGVPVAQDA